MRWLLSVLRLGSAWLVLLAILALMGGACAAPQPKAATPDEKVAAAVSRADSGEDDFLTSLDGGKGKKAASQEPPIYVTALNFIFRLALVLALAYGTIYALKRFTNLKNSAGAGRRHIRVVENSMLAANRSLHLVEVGAKTYLVGSTPGQVNLIAEMESQDLPEAPVEEAAGFKSQLAGFLGGQSSDPTSAAQGVAQMLRDSSAHFHSKVVEVAGMRRKFRDG